MESRKRCPSCNQQLAPTAYYRHVNDTVGSLCPSKSQRVDLPEHAYKDDEEDSASLSSVSAPRSVHLTDEENVFSSVSTDSSFNFSSDHSPVAEFGASGIECLDAVLPSPSNHDDDLDSTAGSILSSNISSNELSAEEIWETTSDEEDASNIEQNPLNDTLYGISMFLNFFQLTFRISERAMVTLLAFLRTLLLFLSRVIPGTPALRALVEVIPKSLYSIRKLIKKHQCGIVEYVVCPTCHHLYELQHCIITQHGHEETKLCDFIEFPHHPHAPRRSKCNTPLMKSVHFGCKSKLVPRKSFFYHSVISGLEKLIAVKGFLEKCEEWRKHTSPSNVYTDVYDGRVWKGFMDINGHPFLASPANLCFILNVDWFNPFEETQYSVGAIYLAVQNLPRAERFKEENIILIGLIPGPKEPTKTINTFLEPLVNDLLKLFNGVDICNPHSFFGSTMIRAILSCVSCDLPATRKVCGFMGVKATMGCSKCLKQFVTQSFGDATDYSGYMFDSWVRRDLKTHKEMVYKAQNASTKTQRNEIEKSIGVRFSELLRLPYFDIIRHHVVDPMHNLFLGIAKHTVNTWKQLGILKQNSFEDIQKKADSINPPPKIGRIPRKIESGFTSFTADEWKHWILIYSVYCLNDVLPAADLECWCFFVNACYLICQLVITDEDIKQAQILILQFCNCFEKLYGRECCTPNMHMICHLPENILDYGPLTAFWAFSFERYNGALEKTNISWRGPEVQMFKKFLDLQTLKSVKSTSENGFMDLIYTEISGMHPAHSFSSVDQMAVDPLFVLNQSLYFTCPIDCVDAEEKNSYRMTYPYIEKCFCDFEMKNIMVLYSLLYPEHDNEIINLSRFYLESKRLIINSEEFITTDARSKRSCVICAHWPGVNGVDLSCEEPIRVGSVRAFICHKATIRHRTSGSCKDLRHMIARIQWFDDHPCRDYFHQTIIVSATTYEENPHASFMPVSRIIARCATASVIHKFHYGEDRIALNIPVMKRICK